MGLREEVVEMKNEVKAVKKEKEQSLARELLGDYKKANKRMFVIIIVILIMWFLTIGYLVYVLIDTGTTKQIIEVDDVETIDNTHIKIGDDIWEKSE